MRFLRRLRARWKYRGFDQDLRREIDVHRAMADDDLAARGVPGDERRVLVARRLGNASLAREQARGVWIAGWLDSLWQDVRYAARRLRRHPGFAFATLVILVAAIGVNTAVFSLANALLLRPWALPDPHQLVIAHHIRGNGEASNVPFAEYAYLSERARTVDLVVSREGADLTLDGVEGDTGVSGHFVTGDFFRTLKVPIALGRGFAPDEDEPGRPVFVAVASHRFWQSRLGGDRSAVGRLVGINGRRFVIVGVTPAGNFLTVGRGTPDLWLPFAVLPALFPDDAFARELRVNPSHCCVELAGRLRAGASRAAAQAELDALDRQFRVTMLPDDGGAGRGIRVTDTRAIHYPRGGAPQAVRVFGLVGAGVLLLLLLACANLGNLHLARAAARRPEISMRLSLGASRSRVIRQLLTESLLLSMTAAGLAVAVASMLPGFLLRRTVPRAVADLTFEVDWRLMAFAAALALTTTIATSLTPAFRVTRAVEAGRGAVHGRLRLRATLLAVQVAASVALLFGAVSMARGIARATSFDPGFDVQNVSVISIDRRSESEQERALFNATLLQALERADIAPAGLTALAPFGNARFATSARRPDEPEAASRPVRFHAVSPGYFTVLALPFRAGRVFDPAVPGEVVVNETFARLLWSDGTALGARFNDKVVTGIVADAHVDSLTPVEPTFYQPVGASRAHLVVRRAEGAAERVGAIVAGLEPAAVVIERNLSEALQNSLLGARVGTVIAGSLGVIALVLAAVGMAGVFSFVVAERTAEIGVRRAMGAGPWHVVRLVMRRAGVPLLVGLLAGIGLALAAGPALEAFLFGLDPRSPATLAAAALLSAGTAILAGAAPVLRALRVDPAVTLRRD
jgi:predicted permease